MPAPSTEFIDPAAAAVAGAEVLKSAPEKVEFSPLGDSGIRLRLKPQPAELWKLHMAMWVGAAVCLLVRWSIVHFGWLDEFEFRYFKSPAALFTFLACVMGGVSIMVALIQTMSGPERETIMEVLPGRIKIDRHIGSDHVVREYSSSDVRGIALVHGGVTLFVPMGEVQVAQSMPGKVRVAIVGVVALGLWQDRAVLIPNLKGRGLPGIALYGCDREAPGYERSGLP